MSGILENLWDMVGYKGSETEEIVGGLLGTVKETTGDVAGSIWDLMTTVDPELRATIEANAEALKQERLTPDKFGNTPNAWIYNEDRSDNPNKFFRFFENLDFNAARLYRDTANMLQIPQDVIKPVGELVAGGVLNLSPISGLISEDVGVEQREMANQFASMVKDNFKDWESISNMIANNPLDAMGVLVAAGYTAKRIAALASNPAIKESVRNTLRNMPDPADVMGNAPLIGQFFPNTKIPMIAWHMSPHKFTKFDTAYMGTGEGAQVRGWGIYLAQNKKVGGKYEVYDNLTMDELNKHYNTAIDNKDFLAVEMWDSARKMESPLDVRKRMEEAYGKDSPEIKELFGKKDGDFDTFKGYFEGTDFGRYEVDLPDKAIATMLNDEIPVYAQPQVVRDFLAKEYPKYMELVEEYKPLQQRRDRIMDLLEYDTTGIDAQDVQRRATTLKYELDDIIAQQSALLNRIGLLDDAIPHPTNGGGIYDWLVNRQATNMGDPEGARKIVSQRLHENGILGRRYYDQGSRDDIVPIEDKTENFVVYDSKTATILSRNEVPIVQGHLITGGLLEDAMIATHNLEESALLKHLGAGGQIPMPSMAVSKVDYPLDNFGEITLVGDASLITPSSKTKIYPSDMYSGRAPHDYQKYKDQEAVFNSLDPQELQWHLNVTSRNWLDDTTLPPDVLDSQGLKWGTVKDKKVDYSTNLGQSYLRRIKEKFLTIDPGQLERQMINVEKMKKYGLKPYDYENYRYMVTEGMKLSQDSRGYLDLYKSWTIPESEMLGETVRMMFNPKGGYTPTGKKRPDVPYDPKTALQVMRKKKAYELGAENYEGAGQTRALTSVAFKNLEDIKASRDRIVKDDDFWGEGFSQEFSDARKVTNVKIRNYAKLSVNDKEMVNNMIEDILRTGKMSWYYRDKLDQSVRGEVGKEYIESIVGELKQIGQDLKTGYFESKSNRLVDIGEFKGAIVPKEMPEWVEKLLKSAGVQKILRYGSEKERKELFKNFPELAFASIAIPTGGLLATQDDEQGKLSGGLLK